MDRARPRVDAALLLPFCERKNKFNFVYFKIVNSAFLPLTHCSTTRILSDVMLDRAFNTQLPPVAGAASNLISIIGLVLIGLIEAGCGPPS